MSLLLPPLPPRSKPNVLGEGGGEEGHWLGKFRFFVFFGSVLHFPNFLQKTFFLVQGTLQGLETSAARSQSFNLERELPEFPTGPGQIQKKKKVLSRTVFDGGGLPGGSRQPLPLRLPLLLSLPLAILPGPTPAGAETCLVTSASRRAARRCHTVGTPIGNKCGLRSEG